MKCFRVQHQMNAHLIALFFALGVPVAGASFLNSLSFIVTIVLVLFTIALTLMGVHHINAIKRQHRYQQYCKRLQTEYNRVLKNQVYKLKRLSAEELQLLQEIVQLNPTAEGKTVININDHQRYHKMERIIKKLEISLKETPFDVDWKLVLG